MTAVRKRLLSFEGNEQPSSDRPEKIDLPSSMSLRSAPYGLPVAVQSRLKFQACRASSCWTADATDGWCDACEPALENRRSMGILPQRLHAVSQRENEDPEDIILFRIAKNHSQDHTCGLSTWNATSKEAKPKRDRIPWLLGDGKRGRQDWNFARWRQVVHGFIHQSALRRRGREWQG